MKDDTNRVLPDDLADRFACMLVVELNEYLISGAIFRFPRPRMLIRLAPLSTKSSVVEGKT